MCERLASGGVLSTSATSCRACGAALERLVVDLGVTPLANSYISAAELDRPEPRYPLRLRVCDRCFLMQLDEVADASGIADWGL